MTAFSAKVDEHGQWFDTPLPGRLSDVFGLKTNAFYDIPATLKFQLDGDSIDTAVHHYEVLEPSTATVVARFTNTARSRSRTHDQQVRQRKCNLSGDGIESLRDRTVDELSLQGCGHSTGPQDSGRSLRKGCRWPNALCKHDRGREEIPVAGVKKGIISNRTYEGVVVLGPQEADLIQ